MNLVLHDATIGLRPAQLLSLRGARGVRLECREGWLWITQEGLSRDDFLAAGAALELVSDGLVLVEALDRSTLALAGRKPAVQRPAYRWAVA
jgi:hypothetical protein